MSSSTLAGNPAARRKAVSNFPLCQSQRVPVSNNSETRRSAGIITVLFFSQDRPRASIRSRRGFRPVASMSAPTRSTPCNIWTTA